MYVVSSPALHSWAFSLQVPHEGVVNAVRVPLVGIILRRLQHLASTLRNQCTVPPILVSATATVHLGLRPKVLQPLGVNNNDLAPRFCCFAHANV